MQCAEDPLQTWRRFDFVLQRDDEVLSSIHPVFLRDQHRSGGFAPPIRGESAVPDYEDRSGGLARPQWRSSKTALAVAKDEFWWQSEFWCEKRAQSDRLTDTQTDTWSDMNWTLMDLSLIHI